MNNVKGQALKKNIEDSLNLVKNISDQIDDDYDIDEDMETEIYNDIRKVMRDLILIYGCQEIEKKV